MSSKVGGSSGGRPCSTGNVSFSKLHSCEIIKGCTTRESVEKRCHTDICENTHNLQGIYSLTQGLSQLAKALDAKFIFSLSHPQIDCLH